MSADLEDPKERADYAVSLQSNGAASSFEQIETVATGFQTLDLAKSEQREV